MRKSTVGLLVLVFMISTLSTVLARSPKAKGPERGRAFQPNLVEKALQTDDTSTLVNVILTVDGAIEEAGLVDLLSGKRHYTVFAPTNDAFDSLFDVVGTLPEECRPDLTDPNVLLAVLEYHLARGDKRASGLINSGAVRMLNDDVAMIGVDSEGAFIHNFPINSRIEAADIRTSNGIIHLISEVLIPPTVAQAIQDCVADVEE